MLTGALGSKTLDGKSQFLLPTTGHCKSAQILHHPPQSKLPSNPVCHCGLLLLFHRGWVAGGNVDFSRQCNITIFHPIKGGSSPAAIRTSHQTNALATERTQDINHTRTHTHREEKRSELTYGMNEPNHDTSRLDEHRQPG